ncbi:MAG TPA: AIM24 family protein [Acidimicrobiales bacterium]|nr:AIM24 family protein [Acidimicrobiales bacterium]
MRSDIKGTTMPLLELTLESGEYVISTHGELSWMSSNMRLSQSMSSGAQKGIMGGLKRAVGGGGLVLTKYEADGGQGVVAFGAKLPGQIFPVTVSQGQGYLVHRHGWVCGTAGIVPTVGLQQTFRGGLWGGDGFVLQRLEGEGQAWIELSGEIVSYQLNQGQSLLVHPGHVGLFEDRVSFSVTRMQGIKNIAFGEDGYHLVSLTGPGNVWLQSMSISQLAQSMAPYLRDGNDHPAAAAGLGGVIGGVIGKSLGT